MGPKTILTWGIQIWCPFLKLTFSSLIIHDKGHLMTCQVMPVYMLQKFWIFAFWLILGRGTQFWTSRREWSYKIPSVCLSVCMWQPPSLNHAYKFAEIWHEGRGPLTKKSDRARFWGKNRNWGFFALFFNIPPFCRVICFAGLKNSMGHVILRRKWLS